MSIAEMKVNLIQKITKVEDEKTILKVSELLDTAPVRPSIEQIYQEIKEQYGDTLKRLAE